MTTKGIRGAITVEENSAVEIEKATIELLEAMIEKNKITPDKISHAVFTLTNDLNAAFPAKFARENLGWSDVAMLCFNELNVPNSLEKCLRVLIVVNCDAGFSPEHVYFKGAKSLRADIL